MFVGGHDERSYIIYGMYVGVGEEYRFNRDPGDVFSEILEARSRKRPKEKKPFENSHTVTGTVQTILNKHKKNSRNTEQ